MKNERTVKLFLILCMAWLFYALDGSVIGVLITNESFKKTFKINDDRLGLFSFFPTVGALIGQAGFGSFLNRQFGRKKTFQIATAFVIFGVILQTFPDNWPAVLVGRIMMGVGGDTNGMCLGYYVTEISPKEVRGRALILVQQFSSSFIAIAGAWIAYGISYLPQDKAYSWKVANSLQFVPGVVFFCLIFFLPESPRWLARKHPTDDQPMLDALANIRDLPVTHESIIAEAKEIRDFDTWHVVHGSVAWWNIFTKKSLRKRTFNIFIPLLSTTFSGVGLLTIYAVIIYQSLGLNTQHNSLLLTSCLQILYAAAASMSAYVVERLGRRTCIVWGSVINTIGVACITGLSIGYEGQVNKIANGWVVAFIVLMTFNYWFLSTGPTVVYINEVMPSQAREFGVAYANLIPIGISIALGQKWPLATSTLGAKSYIILLCTSSVSVVLNWWFLVEHKRLSIEHIDALFGEHDKVEEVRAEIADEKITPPTMLNADEKHAAIHREQSL